MSLEKKAREFWDERSTGRDAIPSLIAFAAPYEAALRSMAKTLTEIRSITYEHRDDGERLADISEMAHEALASASALLEEKGRICGRLPSGVNHGKSGKAFCEGLSKNWRLRMSDKIELLPCPFCGAAALYHQDVGLFTSKSPTMAAYCSNATCFLSRVGFTPGQWNTRHEVVKRAAKAEKRLASAVEVIRHYADAYQCYECEHPRPYASLHVCDPNPAGKWLEEND